MIELLEVSKSFGGTCVLQPTTLTIPAGKTTVLLGPSGCGKSTLLRLMVGLIQPDTGEIKLNGETLQTSSVERLRQRLGYVIQDGGLFPHLSVQDNVTLLARHLGWAQNRCSARVRELADLVRMKPEFLTRYPAELSGGQRQRVGMMRALMLDPAIVLLDEPMGALDPLVRHELQQDLRGIFRALAKTVVLVTHDLGEAAYLGDIILLLGNGRVVQRGTYEELAAQPAEEYVTRFLNAQRLPG